MIQEVIGFTDTDVVDEDVYVFYNVTLRQDINDTLKVGMYFEFANWNGEKGLLELLDGDGKILHTITMRLEVVSVEHH